MRLLVRLTVALALGLLLAGAAFAQRAVWVKGFGLGVTRNISIYASPNASSKVLRRAYAKEILTSVEHAPKGWFKVYCPHNTRGYVRVGDVEKMWERDARGRLKDAWVGRYDARSDYYDYEIVNPEHPDEGESVPLRVAHYFEEEGSRISADAITRMGSLAMSYVLGKLQSGASKAPADHERAVGLLASYGPLARSGILFLLNSTNWEDRLHAAETMRVLAERLSQAEHSDPKVIASWCEGMGGFGEVAQPGMYYPGETPAVKGIPEELKSNEEMRAAILKDPQLSRKVYAALCKYYAVGRSKELTGRMNALLRDKHPAVRRAAAAALAFGER